MSYWRLSGFYFFYFAVLGVLAPYWTLYLESLDFDPVAIGQLMALTMVSRIVAPNVWGWAVDHHGRRMRVLRLTSFLTALTFVGAFFGDSFWWLAVVMLLFTFFWNASLPLVEVTALNRGGALGAYGRVRLWGSFGFIVTALTLGVVVDRWGAWWVLPALLAAMLFIWLFSLFLPDTEMSRHAPHPERLRTALKRPEVIVFLLACVLMQASHGPYYTFYSIYLDGYSYSKTAIGALWALGVLCEIVVFLVMQHVLRRLKLRQVLLASFLLAVVRWLLIGFFPEHVFALIAAQILHGATFGSFHASAIQVVHRFFTGQHQHRGQAIYGSVSFGIGGAIGSLYSGYIWVGAGSTAAFMIAASAAGLAFVVAYFGLRPKT